MSDKTPETPQQQIENLLRIADDALQRIQNHALVDNPPKLILADAEMGTRAVKLARKILETLK